MRTGTRGGGRTRGGPVGAAPLAPPSLPVPSQIPCRLLPPPLPVPPKPPAACCSLPRCLSPQNPRLPASSPVLPVSPNHRLPASCRMLPVPPKHAAACCLPRAASPPQCPAACSVPHAAFRPDPVLPLPALTPAALVPRPGANRQAESCPPEVGVGSSRVWSCSTPSEAHLEFLC